MLSRNLAGPKLFGDCISPRAERLGTASGLEEELLSVVSGRHRRPLVATWHRRIGSDDRRSARYCAIHAKR